jgi:hypothetical protein
MLQVFGKIGMEVSEDRHADDIPTKFKVFPGRWGLSDGWDKPVFSEKNTSPQIFVDLIGKSRNPN